MELGLKLGLEKKDLLDFITEQQKLERDERAAQRQLEKEKIKADREAEEKRRGRS